MNVYITYDRYEHDEWLSVYRIETNKKRAIKLFKEVDLVDFLSYGPDDCHSFQLQKIVLSVEDYHHLCQLVENEGKNDEDDEALRETLIAIYDELPEYESEVLFFTDGCSDNCELIEFYCHSIGIEDDESDEWYEAEQRLFNDDELYGKILKQYIRLAY